MDLNGDLSQTQILVHCDGFAVRRMGRGSRLRRVFWSSDARDQKLRDGILVAVRGFAACRMGCGC